MTPAGLLLTGGASTRLGRDKATLVVGGETLAAHGARVLASVCSTALEVGPGVSGLSAVREDPAGGGPLAALVAGAAALGVAADGGVVLLACDLPAVETPMVRLLAEWPGAATVVPTAGGAPQFVCARYGAAALVAAVGVLARGGRSLRALLEATEHDFVTEEAWGEVAPADVFADVDTPADLARLDLDGR